MVRIYEVSTELKDGTRYGTYKVAARSLPEAMEKITAKEITPYPECEEHISEVKILARED